MAWMVKLLGASEDSRYQGFLSTLSPLGEKHKRFNKHLELALSRLPVSKNETYAPDEGFLSRLREGFNEKTPGEKASKERFNLVQFGDNLSHVFEELGQPNDLKFAGSRVINYQMANIQINSLALKYQNYGILYLSFKKQEKHWSVDNTSNAYQLVNGDKDIEPVVELILSEDWNGIIKSMKSRFYRDKLYPLIVYDVAMERMFRSLNVRSKTEERMLASLAKFVASSGDARYKEEMFRMSKISKSPLVRRQAMLSNKKLKRPGGGVFVRGELNIGLQGQLAVVGL